MKSVAIVTSALNEEDLIIEFLEELQNIFERESEYQWKVYLCDNSSTDGTWKTLLKNRQRFPWLTIFQMSRTFTLDTALTAGLDLISEDAVITMASDLQDTPETISEFLRLWESGSEFVVARVTRRKGTRLWVKAFTLAYYKIASWLTNGLLLSNVSDFRLMTRLVYENVRNLREEHRFLRGLTAWVGFTPDFVEVERPARRKGKSKTKFWPVFNLATKGIIAHSNKPIALISVIGLIAVIANILLLIGFAILWLQRGVPFDGFGTVIFSIFFTSSFNLFFLSVVSMYVGLIYSEVKKRPLYVLRKVLHAEQRD